MSARKLKPFAQATVADLAAAAIEASPDGWPVEVPSPLEVGYLYWRQAAEHAASAILSWQRRDGYDAVQHVTVALLILASRHRYRRQFCALEPAERAEVILDVYEALGYDVREAGWR